MSLFLMVLFKSFDEKQVFWEITQNKILYQNKHITAVQE